MTDWIERTPGAYWVVPELVAAGPHPEFLGAGSAKKSLERLSEFGLNSIVDLTKADQADLIAAINDDAARPGTRLRYRSFPIPDMQVPAVDQMADILDHLQSEMAKGRRLYLHCRAGLGRTGTVAACFLVRRGATGSEALGQLIEIRQAQGESTPSPETEGQRRFVRAWEKLDPALTEPKRGDETV